MISTSPPVSRSSSSVPPGRTVTDFSKVESLRKSGVATGAYGLARSRRSVRARPGNASATFGSANTLANVAIRGNIAGSAGRAGEAGCATAAGAAVAAGTPITAGAAGAALAAGAAGAEGVAGAGGTATVMCGRILDPVSTVT